jgi:predicted peptidase
MAQATNALLQPKTFTARVTRTAKLEYLLFLPADYGKEKAKRWPLLLFLHGAGERGTNLWLVTKHGPPKIVTARPDFPFVVVSPQCPEGRVWDKEELIALLDDVIHRYKVDKSRVYLTGLSMGGYGTWGLGLAWPERFAAIVPICGGGDPVAILLASPQKLAALKALPVWAFHGAKDPVVKLEESQRMVAALRQIGGQEVELTVFPEAGHDSWSEAYDDPKLYDWLLRHQRK